MGPVGLGGYLDRSNCLACHGDSALTKTDADGQQISLYVDPARLPLSVHRWHDCTTCHSTQPHEVKSPLSKRSEALLCGSCHEYQLELFTASIHGTAVAAGNRDAATCSDCHSSNAGPHDITRTLDQSSAAYPRNVAATCARCHDDERLMSKYGIVEKVYDSYMRSFHGKAIELSSDNAALQQLDTATCINCHGSHDIKSVDDPTASVAGMDNLAKICEECHEGAGPEFASGFLGHKAADPAHLPGVYWGEKIFFTIVMIILGFGLLTVGVSLGLRSYRRVRHGMPTDGDGET